MAYRDDLKAWVLDALSKFKGEANIVEIAEYIWDHYESDLRVSGDLFFTWQYDMRWAATS